MNNKLILGMLLILGYSTSITAQKILWEKSLGGKHAEYLYDAIATPDYGFILAGSSLSDKNGNKDESNKGDLDYWLWKMDEKGNLEWQKSFGGNKVDLLQSVALTYDGGFILGGTSSSDKGTIKTDACKGQEDFWIIKLNAKGQEMWQKTIGGSGMEKLLSIAPTKDGGYILGGTSSSDRNDTNGTDDPYGKWEDSNGNLDYWVVKLDSKGTVEWQKTLGGKYHDELKSIHQTQDGGFVLGGYSNSPVSGNKTAPNFGLGDYWVVKLNEDGNVQWQQTYGGDGDDNLFSLIPTKDGGYLLGGNSNSGATNSKSKTNKSGTDFWVIKTDAIGLIQWQDTYDFGKYDVLTSLVENKDGSFLIGGYAQSELGNKQKTTSKTVKADKEGISDYIALKIDAEGKERWSKTVGSKGDEVLRKLLETRDGGYLLAGISNGSISRDKKTAKGGNDFWVVKLRDKEKEEKERITLEAIPNPASSFTNVIINFEYKKGTATLYDLSGRSLQTITITGERTVPVELNGLPQGIYVIEIKTDTEEGGVKVIKK
jgi:hypothetical protein